MSRVFVDTPNGVLDVNEVIGWVVLPAEGDRPRRVSVATRSSSDRFLVHDDPDGYVAGLKKAMGLSVTWLGADDG